MWTPTRSNSVIVVNWSMALNKNSTSRHKGGQTHTHIYYIGSINLQLFYGTGKQPKFTSKIRLYVSMHILYCARQPLPTWFGTVPYSQASQFRQDLFAIAEQTCCEKLIIVDLGKSRHDV